MMKRIMLSVCAALAALFAAYVGVAAAEGEPASPVSVTVMNAEGAETLSTDGENWQSSVTVEVQPGECALVHDKAGFVRLVPAVAGTFYALQNCTGMTTDQSARTAVRPDGATAVIFDSAKASTFLPGGKWLVAESLVVGGGGAGGNTMGGGGGGGGVAYSDEYFAVTEADSFAVTVGAGGTAGTGQGAGKTGGASSLSLNGAVRMSVLGGGGGSGWGAAAASGGTGGGGSHSRAGGKGTAGQGYDGAAALGDDSRSGGGGGAGGPGQTADSSTTTAGRGGLGFVCAITGTAKTYGAGGGGGGSSSVFSLYAGGAGGGDGAGSGGKGSAGTAGLAGTGGGGGGGGWNGSDKVGGAGGSGTVVLALMNTDPGVTVAGEPGVWGTDGVPEYGKHDMNDGALRTFAAPPMVFLNDAETERALCQGYRTDVFDQGARQWILGDTTNGSTSCTYVQDGTAYKRIAWIWRKEVLVTVTNRLGRAVLSFDGGDTWQVGTNGWFEIGTEFTVSIREDVRDKLWLSENDGVTVAPDGSGSFTVTGPMAVTARRVVEYGPNLIVNGSFDQGIDSNYATSFEFCDGTWIVNSASLVASEPKYVSLGGAKIALSAVFMAVQGKYRFSAKYADNASNWSSGQFLLSVDGEQKGAFAKYASSAPPAEKVWKQACVTNDLTTGRHTFSPGDAGNRPFLVDELSVQLIAPAAGALAIAVEPARWAGIGDVPVEGGRVFAAGESETFTCPVQAFLNREHSAAMTCTGYRVETWDAEVENWAVESVVTTPADGKFTYVHTGDGGTARRLVWTFDAPALSVTPTHVWAGGDKIEPTDYFTVANWRTAGGQAAAACPDENSIVHVPCPPDPSATTTVKVPRAIGVSRLLLGSPDAIGRGHVAFVLATMQTNEVAQCLSIFPQTEVKLVTGGSAATRFTVGSHMTVMRCGVLSARGGAATYAGESTSASYGGGGSLDLTSKCYGSIRRPASNGAGGKSSWDTANGGGILYLNVQGNLTVDGRVTAEGLPGRSCATGGSVWLTMRRLFGKGRITANGVSATDGTAGGGRIALYQTEATDWDAYTGFLTAYGVSNAGAGTIYRETPTDRPGGGELIVDNNGNMKSATGITPSVTDGAEPFGRVLVSGARLQVTAGAEFVITGALEVVNKGVVTTDAAGGRIELRPAMSEPMPVSVESTSTFSAFDLACTVAGGILAFAPGSKVSVLTGGFVTFVGDEGNILSLGTSEEGDKWDLAVQPNVTAELRNLAVANATASAALVTAYDSYDAKNNVNWAFLKTTEPGDPIAWTGAKDTSWSDGANWDPMRPPCETDVITIPAGCPNAPVLTSSAAVNALTVASGAALTLTGCELTVTNALTCAGTLRCTGTETIRLEGDADFTGGTFDPGNGLVLLCGAADQTVTPDGAAFASLTVDRPAGGRVAFAGPFSVTNRFWCVTQVPLALAFGHGVTATLACVNWNGLKYEPGEDGGTYRHLLSLVSDQPGARWYLDVQGDSSVRGVTVSDSDATAHPLSPRQQAVDGGNNVGWTFDAGNERTWTGAAGTANVDDPGNWMPAGVPGPDSELLFTAGASGELSVQVTGVTARAWAALRFNTVSGGSVSFTCRPPVTLGSSLEIPARATVAFDATGATNLVNGNVTVRDGGTLTHSTAPAKLFLETTGDLTVERGGKVNVVGKNASNAGSGSAQGSSSYGGLGRASDLPAVRCYGCIRRPLDYGSGGANWYAGCGGGVCRLIVGGTLRVDGSVNANGAGSPGAATGGSIWLTMRELTGGGTITANGSSPSDYSGSGGRIALYQTEATGWSGFTGTVSAYSSTASGAAGTIYRETIADVPDRGELLVANRGFVTSHTQLAAAVTDAQEPFGEVTVTGGCLSVEAGQLLRVTDALKVVGGGVLMGTDVSGTVQFDPRGGKPLTVTVDGTSTFEATALVCTNAGECVRFAGEGTVSVATGGRLLLGGADGRLLELSPVEAQADWRLHVGENVSTEISCVAVSNSVANGASLAAYDSLDRGGNTGWSFLTVVHPGDPIAWTGAKDASWGDGANWQPARVPCETDAITVPAGCGTYPVMTADFTANRLTVAEGASLTLDGANLSVTNSLDCNGAFVCRGAERIVLSCDASFAGGSISPAQSLFVLCAEGDQVFLPPETALANLTVDKPAGGQVTFAGDLATTGDFRCRAVEPLTLAFAAGRTFAPAILHLDGFTAGEGGFGCRLSLVSTEGETAWKLRASERYDVRGVRVQDSDATAGVEMTVGAAAKDEGRNTGWNFEPSAAYLWTGLGANAQFDNPTNWCPAAVPPAGAVVRFATSGSETNAVTVTGGVMRAFGVLSFDTSSGGRVEFTSRAPLSLASTLELPARVMLSLDATNALNEVAGDVILRKGATLTHSAGAAYKLRLKVAGDMLVESGASVDVTAKGPYNTSYSRAPLLSKCRSHGGVGYKQAEGTCYGSVFRPVMHGSGGWGSGWGESGNGGGVVYLVVGGRLTLAGSVRSDGGSFTGTGGSIWISAGTMSGGGLITAWGTGATYESAGGGRIALYQTEASDWDAFAATVSAAGTDNHPGAIPGGAGTVYRQHAGQPDGGGEITVTSPKLPSVTELPMLEDGNPRQAYRKATLKVGMGTLLITNALWKTATHKMSVDELELNSADSRLALSGSVIRVSSRVHEDGYGWTGGKYSQLVVPGAGGRVEWGKIGTVLIVK